MIAAVLLAFSILLTLTVSQSSSLKKSFPSREKNVEVGTVYWFRLSKKQMSGYIFSDFCQMLGNFMLRIILFYLFQIAILKPDTEMCYRYPQCNQMLKMFPMEPIHKHCSMYTCLWYWWHKMWVVCFNILIIWFFNKIQASWSHSQNCKLIGNKNYL